VTVGGVAPLIAREVVPLCPVDGEAEFVKPLRNALELGNGVELQRGVRLESRRERIFHSDVDLGGHDARSVVRPEPDAAFRLQILGLLDLAQSETLGVELTGAVLGARRAGDLDVVQFHCGPPPIAVGMKPNWSVWQAVDVPTLIRPGRYPRSSRYDPAWVRSLDMGPHPLWQLEDLLPDLRLQPGDRVLDLGCGLGASSVFLAREAEVSVVATDLWVDGAELRGVLEAAGVGDQVAVVRADARQLPFDAEQFDAIVSIDAFEYFGTDVSLLPSLLRVLRVGGRLGISTPALSVDPCRQSPPPQVTAVVGEEAAAWHAPHWWKRHWELTGLVSEVTARMQPGSRDDWIRWTEMGGVEDDPVRTMLTSMAPDEIGFALVSATKGPAQLS